MRLATPSSSSSRPWGSFQCAILPASFWAYLPSGHSLQAASLLAAFWGLSLVYPRLREKLGLVLVIGIIFALVVMACRMILGAHFLSDVSMGALVSVIAFLILMALQKPRQGQEDKE